jgi:hypothetical protein
MTIAPLPIWRSKRLGKSWNVHYWRLSFTGIARANSLHWVASRSVIRVSGSDLMHATNRGRIAREPDNRQFNSGQDAEASMTCLGLQIALEGRG